MNDQQEVTTRAGSEARQADTGEEATGQSEWTLIPDVDI